MFGDLINVKFRLQESLVLPANYLERLPSDLRVDVSHFKNTSLTIAFRSFNNDLFQKCYYFLSLPRHISVVANIHDPF